MNKQAIIKLGKILLLACVCLGVLSFVFMSSFSQASSYTTTNSTSLTFVSTLTPQNHWIVLQNTSALVSANLNISFNSLTLGGFDIYLNNVKIGNITTSDSVSKQFTVGILGNLTTNNNITYVPEIASTGTFTSATLNYVDLTSFPVNITPVLTPNGNTFNASVIIKYNYSIGSSGQANQSKLSFNAINFSLYDKNVILDFNFDNRSSLGENDTRVVDLSIYQNNGTLNSVQNGTWTPSGKSFGAFQFNGNNNQGIRTNLNPNITLSGWTILVWVNNSKSSCIDGENIISKGFEHRIYLQANCAPFFTTRNLSGIDKSQAGGSPLTDSKWHSLIYGYNVSSDSSFAYQDNVLISTITNNFGGIFTNTNNFSVGDRDVNNNRLNASVDEVMIFNRTLSVAEINQLYNSQITKYDSSNWSITTNQSLNRSLVNSTSPMYSYNYYLCVSNSSSEVCSLQTYLNLTIPNRILSSSFVNSIGNVRSDFYGAGLQSAKLVTSSNTLDTNCDGTSDAPRNLTFQQQTYLNGGFKTSYYDSSFVNYYSGIYDMNMEDWKNTSYVANSTSGYKEMAIGWLGGTEGGKNGTLYLTTDAHSGQFAIQINSTEQSKETTIKRGDGTGDIRYRDGYFYNWTLWAKGQGTLNPNLQRQIGNFPDCFPQGVVNLTSSYTQYSFTCNMTGANNLTDINGRSSSTIESDGVTEAPVEYRFTADCVGNCTVDDFNITENGIQMNSWRIGDLSDMKNQTNWDYANGVTSMLIMDYMPPYLANISNMTVASKCISNYSDSNSRDCPAYDPQRFADISIDFYKRVDQNRNVSTVQIWNEPDGTFFEDKLTSNGYKPDFVPLFNKTYVTFKAFNPNIVIAGYRGLSGSSNGTSISNFTQMMLSNLSSQFDVFSYHPYDSAGYTATTTSTSSEIAYIKSQCTLYGATCSKFSLDEWQPNYALRNISNAQSPRYSAEIATFYQDILNSYPASVSAFYYHWDDPNSYFNCPSRYAEYPSFWSGISEAGLDNPTPTYYPPYNVTQKISTLCPPSSTVYNYTSDDSLLKGISCKKGNKRSVIIINTDTTTKNVTLNLTTSGITTLRNIITGQTYTASSATQLGIIDSYGILYLTEDLQAPTINITSPISNFNYNTLSIDFNVTLDEEGSYCGYSLDGAPNVSMTKQGVVSQFAKLTTQSLSKGYTVVFSCNDTFGNMASTSPLSFTIGNIGGNTQNGGNSGTTGSGFNSTLICNYVYDFLLTKGGKKVYTSQEVNDLRDKINIYSTPSIDNVTTQNYIDNFETVCGRSLPNSLNPLLNNTNFTIFNYNSSRQPCTPTLNTTLTILNAQFNLDQSMPFFHIDMGQASCGAIDFARWLFRIEGTDTYSITGLKLWWILSATGILVIILLYRNVRKSSIIHRKPTTYHQPSRR